MKMRVDALWCDPATLEESRFPCWEWDGEKVVELHPLASNFREVEWVGRIYTAEDGMEYMRILRKTVRGSFVAATEPYEVEEGE